MKPAGSNGVVRLGTHCRRVVGQFTMLQWKDVDLARFVVSVATKAEREGEQVAKQEKLTSGKGRFSPGGGNIQVHSSRRSLPGRSKTMFESVRYKRSTFSCGKRLPNLARSFCK